MIDVNIDFFIYLKYYAYLKIKQASQEKFRTYIGLYPM